MQEILIFECAYSHGLEGLNALLAFYSLHCHSNRSTTAQHFFASACIEAEPLL